MLDLGFIVPIRRIVSKLPKQRQTLLFSATMPQEIAKLASEMLHNPARVEVTPVATTAERIAQRAYLVDAKSKRDLLVSLLNDSSVKRALVFTRTKRGADRVAKILDETGVASGAIHGNKSQGHRQRTLGDFKAGKTRVLVATDIAARGIDVDGVTHVINFELPEVPETYVHRIGRTARAGAEGIAISLCDNAERHLLRAIEKTTRQQIPTEDRRDPNARNETAQGVEPEARNRRGPSQPRRQHAKPPAKAQRPNAEGRAAHRPAASRAETPANKPQGAKNRRRRWRKPAGAQA